MRWVSGFVAFVLVAVALLVPRPAFASSFSLTQGQALATCQKWLVVNWGSSYPDKSCLFTQKSGQGFVGGVCPSGYAYQSYYWPDAGDHNPQNDHPGYQWCVPAQCPSAGTQTDGAGDHDYAGLMADGATRCHDGCMEEFRITWGAKLAGTDDSSGTSVGHFVSTGGMCTSTLVGTEGGTDPVPDVGGGKPVCNGAGCADPDHGFCGTTESGEMVCEPRDPPPPGGCASGATGAVCVGRDGNPPPPPPNPPIPKDTPPDVNNNYYVNNGGNVVNISQTVYSGTSDGGGPDSGGAPSPGSSSGSSGGVGSQSNTNGNGNSGSNGTDENGKCPNGSVPTASGCSGTATDNGCDVPPQAYGDAILAAQFKELVKIRCGIEASSGSSVGNVPDLGDPMDGSGDPGASTVTSEVDAGTAANDLDGSGFGFGTSCPLQDIHVTVMGSSVDIPLEDKCDLLSYLRYVVLAMAYFAAAKIIAGVK